MQALQRMVGDAELTEDTVRAAIASLTPDQRRQLLVEGQDLKRDILTKEECTEDRNLYFKEVNRSADQADLPVDKDGSFIAKKISDFMERSSDEMPHAYLLEALAQSPYLIKVAVGQARDEAAANAAQSDLAEIEAALSLLRVAGYRESDELASRPPFVRRNLLLMQAHLNRERLRALQLASSTRYAIAETVDKARRLLDMALAYSLQVGWVRATMCITELQGLVTNGLWDNADDECRSHMKTKLSAVGLKLPKISIQGHCSDVAPGERVKLTVTLTRLHAHSPSEMAAMMATTESESSGAEQQEGEAVEAAVDGENAAEGDVVQRRLAAAFGGEAAALGKEGWWLVVESLRGHLNLAKAGLKESEPVHNSMVGRQALSPSLDDPQWCADIEFDAPTTPGEYKIVIHVRSSTMIGVDAKRKVSFSVCSSKMKRSLPSSSSHSSTEGTESCMDAMDEAIAEIEEKECGGDARFKPEGGGDAGNAPADAPVLVQ